MVSSVFTYLPLKPGNRPATWKGWLRKRCTLRARATVSLSSSDSSSIPRMAMMSCSSLYRCNTDTTRRAARQWRSPTLCGSCRRLGGGGGGVRVGGRGRRCGVGQVVGRHIDGLHRGDRALLGGGDALLHLA